MRHVGSLIQGAAQGGPSSQVGATSPSRADTFPRAFFLGALSPDRLPRVRDRRRQHEADALLQRGRAQDSHQELPQTSVLRSVRCRRQADTPESGDSFLCRADVDGNAVRVEVTVKGDVLEFNTEGARKAMLAASGRCHIAARPVEQLPGRPNVPAPTPDHRSYPMFVLSPCERQCR
jgi:Domain of unknown function (DUF4333)